MTPSSARWLTGCTSGSAPATRPNFCDWRASMSEAMVVTSNVARDMLATADEFGSVPKMVVEYASNGLDNPNDPAQPVTVQVEVRRYGMALSLIHISEPTRR